MFKRGHLVLQSVLMALVATGCAGLRGLQPRRRLVSPAELKAGRTLAKAPVAPSAWPGEAWWARFKDVQLDRLEHEALASNPSLDAAQARVEKAVALAGVARAAGRPGVDAALQSTRQRYSENDIVPRPPAGQWETANGLAFDFRYELDFWHKNRAALAAALSRVEAARVDAFEARLVLSVAVARGYVQLARLYEQLDVAQATLDQRKRILDLTRQRVAAGLDTRVELEQAEGALPAARVNITALREALALTRHQLAALLGAGPDRGLDIAGPELGVAAGLPVLPSAVPADLLGRRPDVIASRRRVEAAAQDIVVAKSAFYPDINLLTFAGFSSIGLSQFIDTGSRIAGVGPALHLPLFDRKALAGRLAARDADYDSAVAEYNETLIDALRDTSDQLASVRSIAEQRRQQQAALDAAREAYDLALMRYGQGIGSYLRVLSVETELLKQRRREVDLRARDYDSWIGLTRALGGGFDGGDRLMSTLSVSSKPRKST